jgi:hypothetical protein
MSNAATTQTVSYVSDTTLPYSVRASCGHIVIRRMRPSTAGIPYTPTLVIDRPNGAPCRDCEGFVR